MKRVVVVDNTADILDLMRVILEAAGYTVECCTDARSLRQALREPTDLVVLDVFLRGENGCELCRQLKRNEQTRHIPIILTSARLQAGEALAESHADGFLAKPFHLSDLLACVKQHV